MNQQVEREPVVILVRQADKAEAVHHLCHRMGSGDIISRDEHSFYYTPRGTWRYAR